MDEENYFEAYLDELNHISVKQSSHREFIQFASGELGHQYRYSFYWEYEVDGVTINERSLHPLGYNGFDPARSRLTVLMRGYYEDARIRNKELNNIRFVIEETFQYEVGYIMHEMYEKYKKIVEQFNKGERNRSIAYLRLYKYRDPKFPPERLLYGNEKIERTEVAQKLYFEIYHLTNMIHEVTRKWGVASHDTDPIHGLPKGVKKQFFYDTASYNAYQAELKRKEAKYMKRLNKEKNKVLDARFKDELAAKKIRLAKSNELFGVDRDGDARTNEFIKSKMRDYGWEKWNKERTDHNGTFWYRPKHFAHDYGWDVTFSPGQD